MLALNTSDNLRNKILHQIQCPHKKLLIYKKIVEEQDTPRKNCKLIYLDTKNLSADQIKKIEFLERETHVATNKFGLIRCLASSGIKNFDVDSFYAAVHANLRRNPK